MSLPAYAGLGSIFTPIPIENVMRRIGRVFAGSKVLRTTDCLGGDASFEDGARTLGGGAIEHYKPENVQDWALDKARKMDSTVAQLSDRQQRRSAACIHAVLGLDGNDHVDSLLVWCDPVLTQTRPGPQAMAVAIAQEHQIPVHDLANPDVLNTWTTWVKANYPD